jgi:DNA-binding MarR family transcriptional regulator
MSVNQNAELIIKLSNIQSYLLKRVDSQFSVHGISFTEFMVMHHLSGSPHKMMRRIELAESIGLTASGVTRLLLPMEKIGLLTKEVNPRDARVSLVKLTDAGENLYKDSEKSLNQVAENLTRSLSDTQRDRFLTLAEMLL